MPGCATSHNCSNTGMAFPELSVLAVCVGQVQPVAGKKARSGILKTSVAGPVEVHPLGLAGDHVVNKKHHGGPDQAAYLYTQPDYDFWADVLGKRPAPGTFGENLLISGLESAGVKIGQRLRIGTVVLEAAAARIPCGTFAAHMQDLGFVKKFREARRPGIYARVVQEGVLQAGDTVTLEAEPPAGTPTILDTFEYVYAKQRTPEQVRRLLSAPVAERMRRDLEEWAEKLAVAP